MEIVKETQDKTVKEQVSPFVEIKDLDFKKSINIMIQAANAAQRAGALAVRDSVLVAAAVEYLIEFGKQPAQD